jgi:flagellar basal body rod protein FlgC
MSLFNVFGIAGSGMSAQSARLNLTASNLANSQSVATRPEDAYKARHPIFQTVLEQESLASVRTAGVIESNAETEPPGSSKAMLRPRHGIHRGIQWPMKRAMSMPRTSTRWKKWRT